MSTSTSIRVVCRFRPINKREQKEKIKGEMVPWKVDQENKTIISKQSDFRATLDETLWFETTQEESFARIAESSIKDVLTGFNGTIFAYGQTGSGKTWTMFGPDQTRPNPELYGLIPRSAAYLFKEIDRLSEDIVESSISITILEIYMEQIVDLLNPEMDPQKIKVWDTLEGVFIENLGAKEVFKPEDVLDAIQIAQGNRTVSKTEMNAESSRSHCVFTLYVKLKMQDGSVRKSKLNFGDLAGSEKTGKTGAKGKQLEEAKAINQSLTNLGVVMKQLTEGRSHVPFRDSKLTFLLKDSLGGNCKTTLVVACSPHQFNSEETANTLKFATRAKKIKTKVKKNEVLSSDRLLKENKALKERIKQLEQNLKAKGVNILTEKASLKLCLPELDQFDEEAIRTAKANLVKDIRALPEFELCKININVQEGDSIVFELDFLPTDVNPNPTPLRDRLKDMVTNNAAQGETLCQAKCFGDGIDPRLLKKYEEQVEGLEKEIEKLQGKISTVESEKTKLESAGLEERFLFSLAQAGEEKIDEIAKKLESGDRNEVIKEWLGGEEFLSLEENVATIKAACDGLEGKNPIDEVMGAIADLQLATQTLGEREDQLEVANSTLEQHKNQINQLRAFIAGRPVEEDEVIDISLSPLVRLRQIFDFFADDENRVDEFDMNQLGSGLLCLGAQLSENQLGEVYEVMAGDSEFINWELFQEFLKNTSEEAAVVHLVQSTIEQMCQEWVVSETETMLTKHKKALGEEVQMHNEHEEMIQKLETSVEIEEKEINAFEKKLEAFDKKLQRAKQEYDDLQEIVDDNEVKRQKKMKRARTTEYDEQMRNDIFTEQIKLKNVEEKVRRLQSIIDEFQETISYHEANKEIIDTRADTVHVSLEGLEVKVEEAEELVQQTVKQVDLAKESLKAASEKRQKALDILTALDDADKRDPLTGLFTKAEYDYQSGTVLNELGAIHLTLDIDEFEAYSHKKGHLAANNILKHLADNLAEITEEMNLEAFWFRVQSHIFTGILTTATMEETMRFIRKLNEAFLDTGLRLNMGIAPYQKQDPVEWRASADNSLGVSRFAKRFRSKFATVESIEALHASLKLQRLEFLSQDAFTIVTMINQIQTLKEANNTLTDIYTNLKLIELTGVIEENVERVKESIDEFEVRGEWLKDLNTFDQNFAETFGNFHNLHAILEYMFHFRKIRHLFHYFERVDFIKMQKKLVEREYEHCIELKENDAQKLSIPPERFGDVDDKFKGCLTLVEDLERQSWLRQLEIQKEIAFLSGFLFDKHVDLEEDEPGTLTGPRLEDLLDDMEVAENERGQVKLTLDRSRNGVISKADFVLWVLSKEYSVQVHNREEVFASLSWALEDDKKQLVVSAVERDGLADQIGIIPGSRVVGFNGEIVRKVKKSAKTSILGRMLKLEEPFRMNLQTVASCTPVEEQKAFLNRLKVREASIRRGTNNREINLEDPDAMKKALAEPLPTLDDGVSDVNSVTSPRGALSPAPSMASTMSASDAGDASDTDRVRRKYKGYRLGERVLLGNKKQATIKYIGKVKKLKGIQFGLELANKDGQHDGLYQGVRYFRCRPKYGSFCPSSGIKKVVKTLEEQIEEQVKALCRAVRTGHFQGYLAVLQDDCIPVNLVETASTTKPPLIIESVDGGGITEGRRQVLLDMIHKNVCLHDTDQDGRTALHVAAMAGKTELLELLCKHNAPLNMKDKEGRTALHLAASKGQYNIVHMLASNNSGLNVQDADGKTAIMLAALKNFGDVVQLLCDHKAALDVQNNDGRTAVHLCSMTGQTEMVALLIKNGSALNIQDKKGQTPLHLATKEGSADLVELLARNGCNLDMQDADLHTAANLFAAADKLELLQILCIYNCDLSLKDETGATALISNAAKKGSRKGWDISFDPVCEEIVKLFAASGAEIDACDNDGSHALIHAAGNGNLGLVKELLRCGCARDVVNLEKKDALQTAALKMQYEIGNSLKQKVEVDGDYLLRLKTWLSVARSLRTYEAVADQRAVDKSVACTTVVDFLLGGVEVPEIKEEDPQTFTFAVRGAGAKEVNGVYRYRGLRDKAPMYEQLVKGKTFNLMKKNPKGRKNPYWFLCNRDTDFYCSKIKSDQPPSGRWDKCKGIPGPSPHLTKGVFGSWFAYAENGQVPEMETLLAEGIHPDLPDRGGNTAVHIASKSGQIEILKLLSTHRADMDAQNYNGESPLLVAGKTGALQAYQCLLECGADLEKANIEDRVSELSQCEKTVPIEEQLVFIAVDRSRLEDIQFAKASNMSLTSLNKNNMTVVQHALSKHKFFIVNSILTGNYSNVIDKDEWKAFFKNANSGDSRGIQGGLKKGIHIDMPNKMGRTCLMTSILKGHKQLTSLLLQRGANINVQDNDGRTISMLICLRGTEAQLDFMLEQNADMNVTDKDGNSALHFCLYKQRISFVTKLLKLPSLNIDTANAKGETALHLSVNSNKPAIVELILNEKCNIELRDKEGFSALYYAVEKENAVVIKLLVDRGASLDEAENEVLRKRWMRSADDGNMRAINSLIAAGVDVEIKDKKGMSAVLIATESGKKEVLHALLSAGANLNVCDLKGNTPLHLAAMKNDVDLIHVLLDAKGELNKLNDDGQTPLDLAQLEGFEEISQLMIEHGGTNAAPEEEEDFEDDEDFSVMKEDYLRIHSVSVLMSPEKSPLLRVVGHHELKGVFQLQEEQHMGRNLYVSDAYVIRWCNQGWIIDTEVRDEPLGAAVLMDDIASPAAPTDKNWMVFDNDEWKENDKLHVIPAFMGEDNSDNESDTGETLSSDYGGAMSPDGRYDREPSFDAEPVIKGGDANNFDERIVE